MFRKFNSVISNGTAVPYDIDVLGAESTFRDDMAQNYAPTAIYCHDPSQSAPEAKRLCPPFRRYVSCFIVA